ncbi:hypothetical protein BE21_55275 [Sorangium cellulosum]|uniref:Uncharacterized protein n=1 Tax=Sorangium cellulosum TaxID=56 RepID=A0A150TBT4_SORCE|nr:hypothetical protein BE21_55275 [Sorangium cellulosum]
MSLGTKLVLTEVTVEVGTGGQGRKRSGRAERCGRQRRRCRRRSLGSIPVDPWQQRGGPAVLAVLAEEVGVAMRWASRASRHRAQQS